MIEKNEEATAPSARKRGAGAGVTQLLTVLRMVFRVPRDDFELVITLFKVVMQLAPIADLPSLRPVNKIERVFGLTHNVLLKNEEAITPSAGRAG
jgi:hypothetical protein